MPTGRYTDVIERLKPGAAAAGDIVDLDGRVLGRHDGIIHFTVGQRRGLGIAGRGAALRGAARRRAPRRVVVGPREALRTQPHRAARRQLDRRRHARRGARRRPARGLRQGALDAAAAAGVAAAGRGGYRGRTGRRRGRRVARPGLRVLRRRRGPGARARRRLHRARSAAERAPQRRRRHGSRSHGGAHELARHGSDGGDSTSDTIEKAYARWAPVYDLVFGAVFERGRKASIAAAERQSAGASSKSASAPAFRCLTTRAPIASSASTSRRRCCARRRSASPSTACTNVEALAVMDAQHLALARRLVRRRGGAIRHHRGAGSGSDARRVRARAQARRRDHPGQSSRRRSRAAPRCSSSASRRWRAGSAGGRNSAWDAAGATGPSAHGGVRVIERRADAAARPFLADPVRTSARSGTPQRGLSRATRNLACHPVVVAVRLDTERRGGAPWTAISAPRPVQHSSEARERDNGESDEEFEDGWARF